MVFQIVYQSNHLDMFKKELNKKNTSHAQIFNKIRFSYFLGKFRLFLRKISVTRGYFFQSNLERLRIINQKIAKRNEKQKKTPIENESWEMKVKKSWKNYDTFQTADNLIIWKKEKLKNSWEWFQSLTNLSLILIGNPWVSIDYKHEMATCL